MIEMRQESWLLLEILLLSAYRLHLMHWEILRKNLIKVIFTFSCDRSNELYKEPFCYIQRFYSDAIDP